MHTVSTARMPMYRAKPNFHDFKLILLLMFSLSAPSVVASFQALPFLQIDPQFYLRLAQCQAKCADKFTPAQTQHATAMPPLPDSAPVLLQLCQQGCMDSDSPPSASSAASNSLLESPESTAFLQGQHFFYQSVQNHTQQQQQQTAVGQQFRHLAYRIRPLCVQRMALDKTNVVFPSAQDKLESLMAIELDASGNDLGSNGNIRFVVKWRRKGRQQERATEEPQWITASIESVRTFRVLSLRAGLLHQFQVQPVTGNGLQGAPAFSDWLDFAALAERGNALLVAEQPQNGIHSQLNFFSQYNEEHGVAAWVHWGQRVERNNENGKSRYEMPLRSARTHRRHLSLPNTTKVPPTARNRPEVPNASNGQQKLPAMVVFPSCRLQIEWANKSIKTVAEFELDGSDGFLLKNLAFNSEYIVRLLAASDQKNALLEGTFLSMHCNQVFGSGSLACEPEQVRGLAVNVFGGNGTAMISWQQPEVLTNILLYELTIEALQDVTGRCRVSPNARIVSAQATSALISLPDASTICGYEARLTVYDLLGRDANSLIRFTYIPADLPSSTTTPSSLWNILAHLDASLLALLCVAVLVPAAALVALICTIPRKASERRKFVTKVRQEQRHRGQKENGRREQKLENNEEKKQNGKRWEEGKKMGEENENARLLTGKDTGRQQPVANSMPGQSNAVSSPCNSPQSSSSSPSSSTSPSSDGTEVTTTTANRATTTTTTTAMILTNHGEGGKGALFGVEVEEAKKATGNRDAFYRFSPSRATPLLSRCPSTAPATTVAIA